MVAKPISETVDAPPGPPMSHGIPVAVAHGVSQVRAREIAPRELRVGQVAALEVGAGRRGLRSALRGAGG